jgi:hypothetical protein
MSKKFDVYDLLGTHPGDPANARRLVPLEDPEQEALARLMANASYGGVCAHCFTDATTKEEADAAYEPCLIDARHMLCDADYEQIFINLAGWT